MLKVLIVDDDVVSRMNLKTLIDWEGNGFCIAAEAENGRQALAMIERDVPDIVITDMSMPLMNGIDLIDHLDRHFPQVRIIALSAYDDFDYVRQSMKKGAVDYVLKHQLNAGMLLEILKAAEQSVQKRSEVDRDLGIARSVQRRDFLRRLLEGTEPEDFREKWNELEIRLDDKNLAVALAEIDDFPFLEEKYVSAEMEKLLKAFMDIAREIVRECENTELVHLEKGRFAIVFSLGNTTSQLYVYSRLYGMLSRLGAEIAKYLNITACFGVSRVCRNAADLPRAYREAESLLKNKFYMGKNRIFMNEHPGERREESFYVLDIRDEKAILAALRNADYESARRRVEDIFGKVSNMRLSRKSTQMVCVELVNIAIKAAKDNGIGISDLVDGRESPYQIVQKYETIGDLKEWLLQLYRKVTTMAGEMNVAEMADPVSDVIRKAVDYVRRHYQNDLSLADAARDAGVSASYLSRLFKEECGIGFAEYLNRFRVERAKRLIADGEMKLKEIVQNVGFNNYNYFFKVFKEITGMTPSEYEAECKRVQNVGVE
jgi:two-component system response regulator YesN